MSKFLPAALLILFAFAPSAPAAEGAAQAYCRAATVCFSPYHPPYSIACETYGAGCQWWTVPNFSVQCTGFDFFGRWVNFYFRCF